MLVFYLFGTEANDKEVLICDNKFYNYQATALLESFFFLFLQTKLTVSMTCPIQMQDIRKP